MPTCKSTVRWHVFDDAEGVAREAADRILKAAEDAISRCGAFEIVLAGGTTPERTYRLLAEADTDWRAWYIYFGDERCLPADDAERNSLMVAQAWLNHVPIPAENVHVVPAELGAEEAARRYDAVISDALPFDVVLLGMGEDGHTASLFPGQTHSAMDRVHAVHNAPKPPPDRVSLSAGVLGSAQQVLILVTGAGKQHAVAGWRQGEALPVARIAGRKGVDVLLDRAADSGFVSP